ncbi:hypothetical protein QQF64_002156 [Cirrhinus molitorella]|uniref:Uncharacterized protein n=1 Tax=Cirrhinus molitorella TaxID=172907 RepID=A0ABR3MPD1_9TELE
MLVLLLVLTAAGQRMCSPRSRGISETDPRRSEGRIYQARRADWTVLRHHVSHVLNSFHWKLANTEGDPSLLLSASLFLSFLALLCSPYPIQTDVIETRVAEIANRPLKWKTNLRKQAWMDFHCAFLIYITSPPLSFELEKKALRDKDQKRREAFCINASRASSEL